MDLFANDLSVHGQFHDVTGFQTALSRLMAMRMAAKRYDRDIHCSRGLVSKTPIPGMTMQQALGGLGVESQRRAVLQWLTRSGPFLDDVRRHSEDDYLECGGEIVTNSAVGEAAFRSSHGMDCGLISVSPSNWTKSPVEVTWRRTAEGLRDRSATLNNWWELNSLETALHDQAPPIRTWDDLRETSGKRFMHLSFSDDCFSYLAGVPFAKSAADRFVVLLEILDSFACAFDESGSRNAEGHQIYRDYFTGERALFSDSSDSEKHAYHKQLRFNHPEEPENTLVCTWHGKISHATLRLHFSWPVEADKPVYVVYAGPKITKR